MKKYIIGGIFALVAAIILIVAIEFKLSLFQILIGFVLFIIPITFFSSFKSTIPSFFLIFLSVLLIYFIYKYQFYDIIIGIFLALLIGGGLYILKVRHVETFSLSDYKEKANCGRNNESERFD